MLSECWKSVDFFEGLYEVSNDGKIRSLDRSVNGFRGQKVKKGKECKQFLRNGYLSVGISKENKVKFFFVHRLMAIAFIPNPENKPTVNHKDGNKLNNSIGNLEWATVSEQLKHANDIGIFKSVPPTKKGDTLSDETKQKMSIARKGRIVSKETRLKISKALKNRK